jgi:glycosyltransferase involved in cell wall biosynthesis
MPNLSLVLPVYNEVGSLEAVVSTWDSCLTKIPGLEHVFIICEDGSTDGTKELVVNLELRFPVINNSVSRRRGYGQAVREGIGLAKTEYVLCIDSDGQIGPPDQMKEIWNRRSKDCFLVGWRHPRVDPAIRLLYSRLFGIYHRVLFPHRLHDPSCPFVFGHLNLFQSVEPYLIYMTEGFWWGFVGACYRLGIGIEEVQIRHSKRFAGKTEIYKPTKMLAIMVRNAVGLLKLRLAEVPRQHSDKAPSY